MEVFLIITIFFFHSPPTSSHFCPLQIENCDSNSRLVVDEDDNDEFRIERVNPQRTMIELDFVCVPLKVKKIKYVRK